MPRMLVVTAALLIAACATAAPADEASGRDCFRSSQVNGFNMVDQNHVRIRVGVNRAYVMTTMWNANDLNWSERIALRSATGWICVGNGLGVEVIGGSPRRNYPIVSIERAPEEPAVQGS